MTKHFNFKKEDGKWYIMLHDYPGPKADLQMVEGADTMLDLLSGGKDEVILMISTKSFHAADELRFIEFAGDEDCGAFYTMESYTLSDGTNNTINLRMWLCPVTRFVFGEYPKSIFVSPRPDIVIAPFTDEQVQRMNEYQKAGWLHPFTCCSHDGCQRRAQPNEGRLVATNEGWVCPCGKYKQLWAHAGMAKELPQNPLQNA